MLLRELILEKIGQDWYNTVAVHIQSIGTVNGITYALFNKYCLLFAVLWLNYEGKALRQWGESIY